MIPFSKFPLTSNEERYIRQSMRSNKLSRDGQFIQEYHVWFKQAFVKFKNRIKDRIR